MAGSMKRVILTIICISFFVFHINVAEAAKEKNKTENRFEAQQKELVLEEEQSKSKKKKRIKSDIKCGRTEVMRVAGFVTNPPFGWVNVIPGSGLKQTQYINAGFSYDLFSQLAKSLNLRITNVGYSSYQDAMRDLRRGRVDVVVGAYYDKRVLGTGVNLMFPGYFTNPIIPIFVKGKEKEVNSWDDLKGLKGVVRQEEMIYSLVFQQLPKGVQMEQVSGSKNAFKKLLSGEADYMITSLYAGESEVRRYKLVDEIYFSPKSLVSPELFFVFSSHTDCRLLKTKLAEELKKVTADKKAYMDVLIGYIDDWGQRFKDKPSLIEEMRAEKEKALHPELNTPTVSDDDDLIEAEERVTFDELESGIKASEISQTINSDETESKVTEDKNLQQSGKDKISEEKPNRPLTPAERIKNL